jgi:signal transduction histidine kinase
VEDKENLFYQSHGNVMAGTLENPAKLLQPGCRVISYVRCKRDFSADGSSSFSDNLDTSRRGQETGLEFMEILRAAAHDIRSPLVNLAAGLKLIFKGTFGQLDPAVKAEVEKLFSEAKSLVGTLEDSIGRAECLIDGTSNILDEVDLNSDILEPVQKELSRELRKRCTVFQNLMDSASPEELLVKGDRFWLKVVFRNLLRNALKYGGKGVKIVIGFESLGNKVQLRVYNSGAPIPEKDRDRLFTKFARLDKKSRENKNGLGLGLHLVREVIQNHGGEIWYEPEENGSSFMFTLPRKREMLSIVT